MIIIAWKNGGTFQPPAHYGKQWSLPSPYVCNGSGVGRRDLHGQTQSLPCRYGGGEEGEQDDLGRR